MSGIRSGSGLSVLGALRETTAGSGLVRELTAAPDLDGWAVVERLLKDLAPLADPVWLVVDDVHHLGLGGGAAAAGAAADAGAAAAAVRAGDPA